MHQLSALKPYTNLFYSRFKVAHHTGPAVLILTRLNLFNLIVTTFPKVTIANSLINQWRTLKGMTTLQMPSLALPRWGWKVPYLFIGATVITLGAGLLDSKKNNYWFSRRISKSIAGIELIADHISAIAAISLIGAGQTLVGGVVLALLAVQMLERSHYISADVSFAVSCLGYLAGAATAGTLIERAFCISVVAFLFLGKYLITPHEYKSQDFEGFSRWRLACEIRRLELFSPWSLECMVLGHHHPSHAKRFLNDGVWYCDKEETFKKGSDSIAYANQILEGYWGKKHPQVASFHALIAERLQNIAVRYGKTDQEKIQIYQLALRYLEKSEGHWKEKALIEKELATLFEKSGNLKATLEAWEKRANCLENISHSSKEDKDECYLKIGKLGPQLNLVKDPKAYKKAFEVYISLFNQSEQMPVIDYDSIFLGMAKVFRSNSKAFLELYLELLQVYEKKRPEQHFHLGFGYSVLADFYIQEKNDDKVLECGLKALDYYSKLKGGHPFNEAVGKKRLAQAYFRKSQWSDAAKEAEAAFSTFIKAAIKDQYIDFYTSLYKLVSDCQQHYPPAADILSKMADLYLQIGNNAYNQGAYPFASAAYDEMEKCLAAQGRPFEGSLLAKLFFNKGRICGTKEEWEKALEFYQKSLPLFDSVSDRDFIPLVNANIALMFQQKGEYQKALDLYLQPYEFFKKSNNIHHKSGACHNIAYCNGKLGNHADALKWAEEACDTYLTLERSKQKQRFYNDIQEIVQACQKSLGETDDVKRLLGKIEKAHQALTAKKN